MNLKRILCVGICVILFLFVGCNSGQVVETKDEAVEIAKNHVKFHYFSDFSEYHIATELIDNKWIVAYCPDLETEYTTGGGGPEIHIEKTTGKVTYCSLQY